ncbi:hypothetical protein VTP01DRAFT_9002 [Rhizomucor pusillus]|uniref:uncharacterized protein n=1 Tax=Rhizomucor pusillus TaxID=4840 RepID=UPI003743AEF1
MAFERSWEAPMEFEYERPLSPYNVFDIPPSSSPYPAAANALLAKARNHFQPKKFATSFDADILVSSLDGIKLDDQKSDLRGIQDLDISKDQQKRPPRPVQQQQHQQQQTNSLRHQYELPSNASPEISASTENEHPPLSSPLPSPPQSSPDDDNNTLALVPQTEHDMIPAPQQQHLHQHLYPPPFLPDQKRSLILFLSDMFILTRNIVVFALVLYLCVQFAITFHRDVTLKMEIYESDRLEEHYRCRLEYMRNRCDPSTMLPAMEAQCQQWQQCLYHPIWIGKTKLLAETIAEICNAFVDTISTKTMIFLLSTLVTILWGVWQRPKHINE